MDTIEVKNLYIIKTGMLLNQVVILCFKYLDIIISSFNTAQFISKFLNLQNENISYE